MKFWTYLPAHVGCEKGNEDVLTYYRKELAERAKFLNSHHSPAPSRAVRKEANLFACWEADYEWVKERRPYYNVWPKVMPHLMRVNLEKVPWTALKYPTAALAIQLPLEEHCLRNAVEEAHAILVNMRPAAPDCPACLQINVQTQDLRTPGFDGLRRHVLMLPCVPETPTIQEMLVGVKDKPANYDILFNTLLLQAYKLVVTLGLLAQDPEIIERDVLAADRDKYEATQLFSLVKRAEQRGVIGWSIGRRITVAPHLRGAHFHGYWCGEGRTSFEYRWLKTITVHRSAVTTLPTGDEDGKNV